MPEDMKLIGCETIREQFANLANDPENLTERIIQLAMQASISQLVNAIAHQLNNSLTTVLGYSQLLQEIEIEKDKSKGYLKLISSGTEDLHKTVENMLVFTRRRNAGLEMVNLNTLIKETIALQVYEIEKRDVAIQFELDSQLPLTVTNPFEMQVVFLNMVKNALQAIENHVNEGLIIVRTTSADHRIYVEFIDNGLGIHSSLLDKIFEPFFTTKTEDKNSVTGLGLTVCQYIILEQQGRLSVESTLGQGARFTIELPVVDFIPEFHNDSPQKVPGLWD